MAIWGNANLSGFGTDRVELAGRIIGQRKDAWHFHDGIRPRWLPKQHTAYRSIGQGYCVMTVPAWLAKQPRFKAKQIPKFSKWSSGRTCKGQTNIQTSVSTHVSDTGV